MITSEALKAANDRLEKISIKGKNYAQVTERVKAFREVCPNGTIKTDIVSLADGVVTMKAEVCDEEGRTLATGLAQEKETSSFINKTSYIENCETSAVGRALGFLGIGVDGSMASAEEVANAITQQNTISDLEKKTLEGLCEQAGLDVNETFPNGLNLTGEQYAQAVKKLNAAIAKAKK